MQENISIEELKDDLQEFHTYIIKSKEFIASVNELTLAHQELQKILATQDERISTDFAELKSVISAQKDEYIAGLVDCDKKSDLMRKDLEEADQSLHAIYICTKLSAQTVAKHSILTMPVMRKF